MSLKSLLLEFNVTDKKEVVSAILNSMDLDIKEVDYKDSGSYGDVFKVVDSDKAIKITTSWKESSKYEKIINKKLNNVINIYFLKRISPKLLRKLNVSKIEYANQMRLVVMDKLEPTGFNYYSSWISIFLGELAKTIYKGVDDKRKNTKPIMYEKLIEKKSFEYLDEQKTKKLKLLIEEISQQLNTERYHFFLETIFKSLIKYRRKESFLRDFLHFKKMNPTKFFPDIIHGLLELKELDVMHSDLHLENIMQDPKTKEYKLIDIQ